jgi:6-phosphogluconolactonase
LRSTEGDHPCHVAIDPEGRWLAAANYSSGSVAIYPIGDDGRLGELAGVIQHSGAGTHPARQTGPHAHSSVFSPDGASLLVADLGIDRLVVYGFDPATGAAKRRSEHAPAQGAGPRHLAFHPDGAHLFLVNELNSTITFFEWGSGTVRARQTLSTLPPDAAANLAADLKVDAAGQKVYVSNRGHDSLAVFDFDPGAGLRLAKVLESGGSWPRGFGLSPDGRFAVVANRRGGDVSVLALGGEGSLPGAPVAAIDVPEPACVVFETH